MIVGRPSVPSFCSTGTILPSRPARTACRRAQWRSRMARLRATASAARSVLDGREHAGRLNHVGTKARLCSSASKNVNATPSRSEITLRGTYYFVDGATESLAHRGPRTPALRMAARARCGRRALSSAYRMRNTSRKAPGMDAADLERQCRPHRAQNDPKFESSQHRQSLWISPTYPALARRECRGLVSAQTHRAFRADAMSTWRTAVAAA